MAWLAFYTLTVTNQSTAADAANVKVTDQLPAGLVDVSDDGAAQYVVDVFDEITGVWSVGSVVAGESKVLKISVTVQ